MTFDEIYSTYKQLKNNLIEKKQTIIQKDLEKMQVLDENMSELCEKITKFDFEKYNLSNEEKDELKKIVVEIKELNKNNEILINHSLNVINGLLSGILNIVHKEKNTYNEKGIKTQENSLNISSIQEEA